MWFDLLGPHMLGHNLASPDPHNISSVSGGAGQAAQMSRSADNLFLSPKPSLHLQAELLDGQKLQGVLTSDEVQEVLRVRGWEVRVPAMWTLD